MQGLVGMARVAVAPGVAGDIYVVGAGVGDYASQEVLRVGAAAIDSPFACAICSVKADLVRVRVRVRVRVSSEAHHEDIGHAAGGQRHRTTGGVGDHLARTLTDLAIGKHLTAIVSHRDVTEAMSPNTTVGVCPQNNPLGSGRAAAGGAVVRQQRAIVRDFQHAKAGGGRGFGPLGDAVAVVLDDARRVVNTSDRDAVSEVQGAVDAVRGGHRPAAEEGAVGDCTARRERVGDRLGPQRGSVGRRQLLQVGNAVEALAERRVPGRASRERDDHVATRVPIDRDYTDTAGVAVVHDLGPPGRVCAYAFGL
eukprot:scaffold25595_cov60-Phaeocystis_antarctica.AAC.3